MPHCIQSEAGGTLSRLAECRIQVSKRLVGENRAELVAHRHGGVSTWRAAYATGRVNSVPHGFARIVISLCPPVFAVSIIHDRRISVGLRQQDSKFTLLGIASKHMLRSPADRDFQLLTFLQKHPYFATMSTSQLGSLARQAKCHTFVAKEVLFLTGEPSAGLWIIEEGRVKVFRSTLEGRECVLHLRGPGETFNDIPALDGGPNAASAMAVADGRAWVFNTDVLGLGLIDDHDLALAVIQGLTQRIRQLVGQIEDLALRPVTGRLARFLLKQQENPSLSGPTVTRALIASHLGTTPETVSRALRTLEEAGAIVFDRHRIIIRNASLLREMAML